MARRPSIIVPSIACAGLVAIACSSSPSDGAPPACGSDIELVVAASDYSSSLLCGAPGCVRSERTTGADLGADPQLVSTNGRTIYLARDLDLLFEVDPACGTPIARASVYDLGPRDEATGTRRAANPHDVAAAPDGTLFVTLFNAGRVALVKDGKIIGDIDLSAYDPDGNPQADAIRIVDVGGAAKAFVTLERLDERLLPKGTSQMVRIDVATRTVEQVVDLAGQNPFNTMGQLGGALFLAEPGNFDVADEPAAGIERFDTATSTTRLLVAERDLGGSVSELAVAEGCAAAIVAGPEPDVNPTALVTFDPQTGQVFTTASAPVYGPTPGYDLQALAWRGTKLYVGDRRDAGGVFHVHVFEREGTSCTLRDSGRVIDLPQKPVAMRATIERK